MKLSVLKPNWCGVVTALLMVLGLNCESQEIDFARDVLPILSDNCFQCHGPDARVAEETGLRLDLQEAVFEDRGGYAAVVANDLQHSELYQRVVTDDESLKMPPEEVGRSLTSQQIETLRQWIQQDAAWGKHWAFEPMRRPKLTNRDFQKSSQSGHFPQVAIDLLVQRNLDSKGWAATDQAEPRTLIRRLHLDLTGLPPTPEQVDCFLEEIQQESSRLSRDDRHSDESNQAAFDRVWERLVDRLLASQAYGERMAWDWLEAARYADSNGYQGDRERTMWPWRDWVVKAFNDNLAFDDFTVWQVAGDQLPEPSIEQILATGFNRNHMINGEGGRIAEENRVEYVMDMTETMGTVWLGLTLNCCRCHDHKFDPLLQTDYYGLTAFFNQTPVTGKGGDPQTAPVLRLPTEDQLAQLQHLRKDLSNVREDLEARKKMLLKSQADWEREQSDRLRDPPEREETFSNVEGQVESKSSESEVRLALLLAKLESERTDEEKVFLQEQRLAADGTYSKTADKLQSLNRRLNEVEASIAKVMVMEDRDQRRETFVLDRGLYNQPGARVPAQLPAFLTEAMDSQSDEQSGGNEPLRRIDLANWIVSERNPLTARVVVNRYWQMLFGVGLVKTAEDFGVQSEYPIQRELLDWLAAEFVDSDWDLKHLIKCIVMSRTYRRSSNVSDQAQYEADPENRYLARGARYRLPSWMLRDQALAVSGLLSPRVAGPPVFPAQPDGIWKEATFGKKQYKPSEGADRYRRTLYTFWRRIIGPTMLFDTAKRQICEVKPLRTNTPMHALVTLNEFTYVQAAKALAQRVVLSRDSDPESLNRLARRVLCRPLVTEELEIWKASLARAREFYSKEPSEAELLVSDSNGIEATEDAVEIAAWSAIALNMLNLDEALSKE